MTRQGTGVWSSDGVTQGLCPARDRDDELPEGFLPVDLVSRYAAIPAGIIDRVVISPGLGSGFRLLGMYSSVGGVFEALDVAHRVLVETL